MLAGERWAPRDETPAAGLRFAVPKTVVLDGTDMQVATAFSRALSALSQAGCTIAEIELAELGELPKLTSTCSFQVAEGYAWHRDLLARKGSQYDPIIAKRFASGASLSARDYIDLVNARRDLIGRVRMTSRNFDAVLMPTVAVVAPRIADVCTEAAYLESNSLVVRNTGIANFLDRCAISLPCQREGEAPVGLTLMGEAMADQRLLGMAAGVEAVLAGARRAS